MTRHHLEPAFAKLQRAEVHIQNLTAAAQEFFDSDPFSLTSKVNFVASEEVWSIELQDIPLAVDSIAADAIHNLRTPLDKMLTAMSIEGNKSTNGIKFPFGRTADRFNSAIASQRGKLPTEVLDFLGKTEAYPEGAGSLLFTLHDIDISDKHHAILMPIILGFSETRHGSLNVVKGFLLRMGSRRGKHLIPVPNAKHGAWHMHQPVEELKPIFRQRFETNEYYLEFTSPQNDREILTTTLGATVHADIKPILSLEFANIASIGGLPATGVLQAMREVVECTLIKFRERFF